MKKILSIMLAVLMAATALFAVTASAEEENRSIKFIKDLVASKTLSAQVDIDGVPSSLVKDIDAKVKFGDTLQVAGTAEVAGIDVNLYASGKDIDAYFSIFRIDVDSLADIDIDLSSIGDEFNPIFDEADDIVKYLQYDASQSTDSEDVLVVNREEVAKLIIEEAAKQGVTLTEEDVSGKTVAEICELARITDVKKLQYYGNLEQSNAHFYYTNGKLTGVKIIMADEETGALETVIDTNDLDGVTFRSISTNVSDSVFSKPSFAINITGLVKFILNFVMNQLG